MELLSEEGDYSGELSSPEAVVSQHSLCLSRVESESSWEEGSSVGETLSLGDLPGSTSLLLSRGGFGGGLKEEEPSRKNPFDRIDWSTKCGELSRSQVLEARRRRRFGRELLGVYSEWAALEGLMEATAVSAGAGRVVATQKIRLEEAYGQALLNLQGLGGEDGPMGEVCRLEARRGAKRVENAVALRKDGLGRLSRAEATLRSACRELRDIGELSLGRVSRAAKRVETLFDVSVTTAAQAHAGDAAATEEEDMWLADAQYRVAATQLDRAWRQCAANLSAVLERAKAVEVDCRRELAAGRTAVFDAADLDDSQWRDETPIEESVRRDLEASVGRFAHQRRRQAVARRLGKDHAHDHEAIAALLADWDKATADADAALDARTKTHKQQQQQLRASASTGSTTQGASGEGPIQDNDAAGTNDDDDALGSPLDSPLVVGAAVLEYSGRRRGGGAGQPSSSIASVAWQPCLAVASADRLLHVFDLSRHFQGEAAAFAELAGASSSSSSSNDLLAAQDNTAGPLRPALSIDLAACSIRPPPDAPRDAPPASLELVETKRTRGRGGVAQIMAQKTRTRKICLRSAPTAAIKAALNSTQDPLAKLGALLVQAAKVA